jgi:hypothetical protein
MDEYIKRDAAIEAVYQYLLEQTVSKYPTTELCNAARGCASGAMEVLNDVPAADVAPVVHGAWEFISLDGSLWCSRCKRPSGYGRKAENKYCRNCGAKMDGENHGTK